MRIAAISGSIRKDSYNTRVLEAMKERYVGEVDIDILDISDLPLYNQDIEREDFESVKRLREQVKSADALIFATPEHNGTIPAALKSFLDWMSRVEYVLKDKPALILGASMGRMGTVKAQEHLKDILDSGFIACRVLPAHDIYIGEVHTLMDEEGRFSDQASLEYIDSVMEVYLDWVEKNK